MTPRRLIEPARLAGSTLLHTQSDERLVDLTRAGNDRAFEAIVSRYRRQLLRYCAGLLPPERAEDAVQQAFLNAYKAISVGTAEIKLRPWLYRVAHNAALNLLRQNGWNHEQIPEDFDGVVQPPQAVELSEHLRDVVRRVKDLPERQRDAIVLRELEGRSYDEIALALGVTDGAVRQLLNRARGTLRSAATALTPPQLLARLAERAAVDAPAATRIAEFSLGAGGAATLAKLGAAFVVAGAVAGGVAAGPLHHSSGDGGGGVAEAAELAMRGATGEGEGGGGSGGGGHGKLGAELDGGRSVGGLDAVGRALDIVRQQRGSGGGGGSGQGGSAGGASLGSGGGGEHSGSGGDGGGSGGSDGGEHSGSGSDGGGSSGSGGDPSGTGSGDSGSDGGGSSGSGSSGSGSVDSGSGSSGSGSSGSGSGDSGSGDSGSSGSGSGDSVSGSSGSGSSGSDSLESGSGSSGPG